MLFCVFQSAVVRKRNKAIKCKNDYAISNLPIPRSLYQSWIYGIPTLLCPSSDCDLCTNLTRYFRSRWTSAVCLCVYVSIMIILPSVIGNVSNRVIRVRSKGKRAGAWHRCLSICHRYCPRQPLTLSAIVICIRIIVVW